MQFCKRLALRLPACTPFVLLARGFSIPKETCVQFPNRARCILYNEVTCDRVRIPLYVQGKLSGLPK